MAGKKIKLQIGFEEAEFGISNWIGKKVCIFFGGDYYFLFCVASQSVYLFVTIFCSTFFVLMGTKSKSP